MRSIIKKIALAGLFGAMFAATAFAQSGDAAKGDVDKGKALFLKNGCYECHGTVGQGGTGPHIAPRTASIAYIRKPAGQMPPYTAKVMSDQDLADVLAYLMSIPAPPKGVGMLNQ
jgi:ubiquinol-cytochrome c reductase cytochrome c subunit